MAGCSPALTRLCTLSLGILLVLYAVIGLSPLNFTVSRAHEKWVGGIVGVITGVVSAATGVQVIPSVPLLQAIGMERDELVQALGVFFTVATMALGLRRDRFLDRSRRRPRCPAPLRWSLHSAECSSDRWCAHGCSRRRSGAGSMSSMILLGLYLAGSALLRIHG